MPRPAKPAATAFNQAIVAYVPALHAGYKHLFDRFPKAALYVLGSELVAEFDQLRKDLRALPPATIAQALAGWGRRAEVLTPQKLRELGQAKADLIMPDEDVSHALAGRYLSKRSVQFEPIFLRWDRRQMEAKRDVGSKTQVSRDQLDQQLMGQAVEEAERSANFWRRVGAVIARDGTRLLIASNRQEPGSSSNWIDGDPRINAHRGESIELTNDMHAEAGVIAEAARRGLGLSGCDLYVTVFPCPTCAKLIANSGVKRLFFAAGYAILDGEEVLRAHGVELIRVEDVPLDQTSEELWMPYPEKKS